MKMGSKRENDQGGLGDWRSQSYNSRSSLLKRIRLGVVSWWRVSQQRNDSMVFGASGG